MLAKRGGGKISSSWQDRFCVLTGQKTLLYYKSKSDKKPKGAIPLLGYKLDNYPQEEARKPYAFKLVPMMASQNPKEKDRTWFLAATSEKDQQEWMKHIGEALGRPASLVNLSQTPEDQKEPILFTAIRESNLDAVKDLLKQSGAECGLNTVDQHSYSPLHSACCLATSTGDEILLCLLKHPDINVNVTNADKNTPLHYFCQKWSSPNIEETLDLMLKKGAKIDAQNNNSETPLHKAIFNSQIAVLLTKLLLDRGADVNKLTAYGETPLHYSIRRQRRDLAKLLLTFGADMTIASKKKVTAYDLAVSEGEEGIIELFQLARDTQEWLQSFKMEKYFPAFLNSDTYVEQALSMDDEGLKNIGVELLGHRVKVLKAIRALEGRRVFNPEKFTERPIAKEAPKSLIEMELEKLKYVNRTEKDWILVHSQLEFTLRLAEGTSGTIYKGLFKGGEVAIKVLKVEQSEKEMDEFTKEFQIMSTIQHKNLVFFFGAALEPRLCMVMELCARGSLHDVLQDKKLGSQVGWKKFFSFANQALTGVKVLHDYKPQILHRDLKSLNLLVTSDFQVKVGDFGLARFNTESYSKTLVLCRGTYSYTAPEVYAGDKYTTRSDVFSIAVILWEITHRVITGAYLRPYGEYPNLKHDFSIIIQTSNPKKQLRPTLHQNTPEKIKSLIAQSWSHEEDKRPECADLIRELEGLEKVYEENQQEWDFLMEKP